MEFPFIKKIQKYNGGINGDLIPLEIPLIVNDKIFEIKRIFYIYNTNSNSNRGNHANMNCDEIIIALNGKCKIMLKKKKKDLTYILENADEYLFIPRKYWINISEFENGSILLILCNENNKNKGEVRDYQEFLDHCTNY